MKSIIAILVLLSFFLSNEIAAQEQDKQMPEFKLLTNEGVQFSSLSLKGKYVLIDFWASWCGPCHKKFPELKEIYKELHDQGLEIVGISTDAKKDSWLADLKKLDLPWIQLIDGQVKESVAVNKFEIRAVPALFFIGPDGSILKENPTKEFVIETISGNKN